MSAATEASTPPHMADAKLPSTWHNARAWQALMLVFVLGLFSDLCSKTLMFARVAGTPVEVSREKVLAAGTDLESLIPVHDSVVAIRDILEFKLLLNPGAVFGMGAGKRWVFVAFTAFAIGFALWMFANWTRPRDRMAHIAIGLVLAGGVGNLYDRMMFACVRDFIHPLPGVRLPFGWSYPWGGREIWPYVSNVADLWLIIGILVLVIHTLRVGSKPQVA